MTSSGLSRGVFAAGFLLLTVLCASVVWHYGHRAALDRLAGQAEADLVLASDRLRTRLQRYQEMAVLMADHPAMEDLSTADRRAAAAGLMLEVADKTGALDLLFADTSGTVLAAAHGFSVRGLSETEHFRRAMQGALGTEFGVKRPLDRRAYYYAAPAFGADGRVRGALIVAVDIEAVERTWSGSVPAVYFTDQDGTVFVSNRSEILGWKTTSGSSAIAPRDDAQARISRIGEHEIWTMDWGPYLPKRALHLVRPLPVIGMTGEVLLDVAPARRLAALQAAVVAAVLLAFGAILFLATERRRTLARANAVLETRVAERTRALSQTNAQLRREVAEREEAEAALKRAQADLVRAGKLTALGQMSAGISHELNQPLMAIQSFAENARQFIDRGQTEVAAGNLARIADLARRMGRIIRNLRAFARQESEPAARVDIVKTLEAAVELTQARLGRDGITLNWTPPEDPIWVRGGEVRLSQVFVNLVTNAADAMTGSEAPEITIRIRQGEGVVTVDVLDTGPGIDDPEKIFDPFYSTKEVGASEGMGLGLSISYGMVQSFGGDIRGRNREEGGAVFSVTLAAWDEAQEVAA